MSSRVRGLLFATFLLLLPGPARAGEDVASLKPGEVLEIEIGKSGRHASPTVFLLRVQGGEPRRLVLSIHDPSAGMDRPELRYDGKPTPGMENSLQLWIDLYREAGLVRDTLPVHERFVLRRYSGGKLEKAEKRFDPDRTAAGLMKYFTREVPDGYVPDGTHGIYGWYTPDTPPDTALLGRLRRKVADPERYRDLMYPWEWVFRRSLGTVDRKDSARSKRDRALKTLDSLSKGLE